MPYRTADIGLDYVGHVIRPPLESQSLILQVTVGCSHNRCRYCPVYKGKKFGIKEMDTVLQDIQTAADYGFDSVFLADGDALIMPGPKLLSIVRAIREAGLGEERISTYANVKSIRRRTDEELRDLLAAGLKRLYIGLESGSDTVLSLMDKGVTAKDTEEQALRGKNMGFEISMTLPLGLGGVAHSQEHIERTVAILKRVKPMHVRLLTLMPVPGTPLAEDIAQGKFEPIDKWRSLEELRDLIAGIDFETKLYANHISNYFPIKGKLPADQAMFLARINDALEKKEESMLRPEEFRGL